MSMSQKAPEWKPNKVLAQSPLSTSCREQGLRMQTPVSEAATVELSMSQDTGRGQSASSQRAWTGFGGMVGQTRIHIANARRGQPQTTLPGEGFAKPQSHPCLQDVVTSGASWCDTVSWAKRHFCGLHEKTSDKPKRRGILQKNWPVVFKGSRLRVTKMEELSQIGGDWIGLLDEMMLLGKVAKYEYNL